MYEAVQIRHSLERDMRTALAGGAVSTNRWCDLQTKNFLALETSHAMASLSPPPPFPSDFIPVAQDRA